MCVCMWRAEKERLSEWSCTYACTMNMLCRGEGWHKIIKYKIRLYSALWSPASSPVTARHLLHRDLGKAICFLQETWHHPSAQAALHSYLGVTFLVVLQSQTNCYPTTCSNEASTAAQNGTYVLKVFGPVCLQYRAALLCVFLPKCVTSHVTCWVHAILSVWTFKSLFSTDSLPVPVIRQQLFTCQEQCMLLIKLEKQLLSSWEQEERRSRLLLMRLGLFSNAFLQKCRATRCNWLSWIQVGFRADENIYLVSQFKKVFSL